MKHVVFTNTVASSLCLDHTHHSNYSLVYMQGWTGNHYYGPFAAYQALNKGTLNIVLALNVPNNSIKYYYLYFILGM